MLLAQIQILEARVTGLHTACQVFREQRDEANRQRVLLAEEIERLKWVAILVSDD